MALQLDFTLSLQCIKSREKITMNNFSYLYSNTDEEEITPIRLTTYSTRHKDGSSTSTGQASTSARQADTIRTHEATAEFGQLYFNILLQYYSKLPENSRVT